MPTPTMQMEAPPLRLEDSGAIRVGNSRVLLELVIHAFEDGATAEEIVGRFPTLTLTDTYGAIHYYLRHTDEMKCYLSNRERVAEVVGQKIDAHQRDLSQIRARILTANR